MNWFFFILLFEEEVKLELVCLELKIIHLKMFIFSYVLVHNINVSHSFLC